MNVLNRLPQDNRSTLLAVWRLGGPVALQSILAALLVFVDTLMVSALGPAALAGVGLINRLLFVVTMVLAGVSSGTGVLVAQYAGARRLRAVRGPVTAAVGLGVLLTLPLALIALFGAPWLAGWLTPDRDVAEQAATFFLFGAAYAPLTAITMVLGSTLRSLGNTRSPMWAGLVALGLNTLLNYLFITGRFGLPGYGVAAAAVATTLARLVEIGWLLSALRPGLPRWIRPRETRLVLTTTLPLMVKEVFWAGGVFAGTLIVGRMGKLELAALNLVQPVEGIMISAFAGCGVASGILLGHALGRRDFDDAFDTAKRLRRLVPQRALAIGAAAAVLVQIARQAGWLQGLIAPELHDMALDSLTVLCIAMGARTHNMMVSLGILRSGNDLTWLMLADLCSMWLINVPLVAVAALVLKWPLPAVVAVMMTEEVLKVAVFRWRVRSGKWLNSIGAKPAA